MMVDIIFQGPLHVCDYKLSVFCASGPISSIMVNKYGSRPVMMAGGCLSAVGLIASSFCNTVEGLYFCIGVLGGMSF